MTQTGAAAFGPERPVDADRQSTTLEELIELVCAWLEGRRRFAIEDAVYQEEQFAEHNHQAA